MSHDNWILWSNVIVTVDLQVKKTSNHPQIEEIPEREEDSNNHKNYTGSGLLQREEREEEGSRRRDR